MSTVIFGVFIFLLVITYISCATVCASEEDQSRSDSGSVQNAYTSRGATFTNQDVEGEFFKFSFTTGTPPPVSQRERPKGSFQYRYGKTANLTGSNFTNNTVLDDDSNVTLNDGSSPSSAFDQRARQDAFNVSSPKESPYSVLLLSQGGEREQVVGLCTGSLLTVEWVLSAAHCVVSDTQKIKAVTVYAGGFSFQEVIDKGQAPGSQILVSSEFYPHPKYRQGSDYDISVIKTEGKFNLTDTVSTVKLSTRPWTYHSYKTCRFTGFGMVQIDKESKQDTERKTHRLAVKKPCLCSFRMKLVFGPSQVTRYICSKPEEDVGVCSGDSGGGLLCDGEVRAVAMQLVQLENVKNCDVERIGRMQCGSPQTFSVFQDTCPFLGWVNSHVQLFNASEISPDCVEPTGGSGRTEYHLGVLFGLLQIQCYNSYTKQYLH